MSQIVDITSTLRDAASHQLTRHVPFLRIARALLPPHYTLSVALTGHTRARRLNRTYRKKEYAPNVLAFSLSPQDGEIILNIRKAEQEACTLGLPKAARVTHLYIHGILHLKGMRHGEAMKRREQNALRRFGF